MAKKELVINTYKGENENSIIFVLSQDISGLSTYERAKAINNFMNKETKVLEIAIETHLRQVLKDNGIFVQDGSKQALERAFIELEHKGIEIAIYDRYLDLKHEQIIGESSNQMTIIEEDGLLSCAMEVEVIKNV